VSGKRIIVHSLAHARAALAAAHALGVPVTLASAAGAGAYAGPLWFKSLIAAAQAEFPEVDVTAVLDCGAEAGTTLAALRHGFKRVRFTGNDATLKPLREIARALDAEIETGEAPEALDLLDLRDPETAVREYLSAGN
jgi:fructose/tagatose bisphosphate aldolase